MKLNQKNNYYFTKLKDTNIVMAIAAVIAVILTAVALYKEYYSEPSRYEMMIACQDKKISVNDDINILDVRIECAKEINKKELIRIQQTNQEYIGKVFRESLSTPYTEPKRAKEIANHLKDEKYKEYNRKAILSRRKLDNASAIEYYERSLKENPNQPKVISQLGWMTQGNNPEFLDKEIDKNFNNATILNKIAVRYGLLDDVNNLKKSISTFKRVIKLQPKYPYSAYKGIMRAYVKLEEYENAITTLKNAMMVFEENIYRIYRDNPKSFSMGINKNLYNYYVDNAYLGFLYFKVGKYQESEKYYQKILNVDFPKNFRYLKPSIEYRPVNGSCKDSKNEETCLNFIKKSLTGKYLERKLSEKGIRDNETLKGIRAMQDNKKNEKIMCDDRGNPVRVIFYTDPKTGKAIPIWSDIKLGEAKTISLCPPE